MNLRNGVILALTVAGVVAALVYRGANRDDATPPPEPPAAVAEAAVPTAPRAVPRFVELGSDRCTSCKAMIPVLAELREAHAGALQVDFIDVWDHPEEAERYGVTMIPTQVLYAPDGAEIFRHQGFFAADAIRARFDALGYPLPTPPEG